MAGGNTIIRSGLEAALMFRMAGMCAGRVCPANPEVEPFLDVEETTNICWGHK